MGKFWIDSSVLIQAKNTFYAFDIAPSFWRALENNAKLNVICSSTFVYDELARGDDELSRWAKGVRAINLFVDPDAAVQKEMGQIGEHVEKTYEQARARVFLSGADPWIIAAACHDGGTVVTQEVYVSDPKVKKIKIPNVCRSRGVQVMNVYEMMRSLGIRL